MSAVEIKSTSLNSDKLTSLKAIYALQIKAGTKKLEEVPEIIRADVASMLAKEA